MQSLGKTLLAFALLHSVLQDHICLLIQVFLEFLLLLSSPLWRSNQSILKEINLEYSLEGLMLKLKSQYFGHLMQRADSLEKTLILRKTEGRRRG